MGKKIVWAASLIFTALASLAFFSPAAVYATGGDTLASGQALTASQSIESANGQHKLVMQPDGNLVEYFGQRALWQTQTQGGGNRVVMQPDGNLVVYSAADVALWFSATGGHAGAYFVLQSDGNLVGHEANGGFLWANYALPDSLESGQTLLAGQFITSANGQHRLVMQGDGNVVEYFGSRALWASGTQGGGNRLVMQPDGNLVVYNASNFPLWFSGTGGNAGARLLLQTDANAVIYPINGPHIWANYAWNDTLQGGETLYANQSIHSPDRSHRLFMQPDGNLVEYNAQGGAVWFSNTQGVGNHVVMQPDGNLVLYNANNFPLWFTGTGGNPGARLAIQNDSNLVVYSAANWPLWIRPSGGGGGPAASGVTVGMPFTGKWARWATGATLPYNDTNSSHPSVHARPGGGDWAVDLYGTQDQDVKLHLGSAGGALTYTWRPVSGGCGGSTGIDVYLNGAHIGWIYVTHLKNAVTTGAITNDMVLGKVDNLSCAPSQHIHMEFKNINGYSCYYDKGAPGVVVGEGDPIALLGTNNATGAQQACS